QKSAPKYGSLECFSSVSRVFLECFSSESRAIFERYSSDTRDLSDTSPVHLRAGLEGDSCLLERERTQIADSAKSISAKSYQIVRNFTEPYQFLPILTKSNKVLRSFTISCEFLPNLTN